MSSDRSLFIEVYSKTLAKKGFLAKNLDEVKGFLRPLVSAEYIESVCECLAKQQENPEKFPNIVIFLDDSNQPITIDEFRNEKK